MNKSWSPSALRDVKEEKLSEETSKEPPRKQQRERRKTVKWYVTVDLGEIFQK